MQKIIFFILTLVGATILGYNVVLAQTPTPTPMPTESPNLNATPTPSPTIPSGAPQTGGGFLAISD